MKKSLFISYCILYTISVFGQFEPAKNILPHDDYLNEVHLADLNGDGHEDIITLYPFAWYENEGDATYSWQHTIDEEPGIYLAKIEIKDLNNDGHLDLIISQRNRYTLKVYINDGNGNFPIKDRTTYEIDFIEDFALDDWDKDGDVDLMVAIEIPWYLNIEQDRGLRMYENDGKGNLTQIDALLERSDRNYYKLFFEDLDNDGSNEVVILFQQKTNYTTEGLIVLKSLGGGSYDTNSLNEISFYEKLNTSNLRGVEIIFADFNQDGYLDFIPLGSSYKTIVWYENDQTGKFTNQHLVHTVESFSISEIEVEDVDDDGDMDIVFANDGIYWVGNQGDGMFGEGITIQDTGGSYKSTNFILTDVNNDGTLDLLIADKQIDLYWLEGGGETPFQTLTPIIIAPQREGNVWQDINNDGLKDFVFLNSNDYKDILWCENGREKGFKLPQSLISGLPYISSLGLSIYFADINGNGLSDLIIGRDGQNDFLYLNQGNQNFVFGSEIDLGLMAKFEDMDNDGDLDIISVSSNTELLYATNNGNGFFTYTTITVGNITSIQEIQIKDFNNDGLKDVFLYDGFLYMLENQGNGNFAAIKTLGRFVNTKSYTKIVLKDYDEDGFVDVLFNDKKSLIKYSIDFSKNNQGIELQEPISLFETTNHIREWFLEDLNQDEQKDLIINFEIGTEDGNQWRWKENQGNQHFGEQVPITDILPFEKIGITELIEDIDGDGATDLILQHSSSEPTFFFVENLYNLKKAIRGYSFWDKNENQLYDSEDLPLMGMNTTLSPIANSAFTQDDGMFFYSVSTGDYRLTSQSTSLWELVTPPNQEYNITVTGGAILPLYNFGFKPTRILPRVEPHLNSSPTRCSQKASYWLTYSNTGTTVANGTVTLEVDELMDFISSNPEPDAIEGNTLIWHFSELYPLYENKIHLQFQMPDFNSMGEILETQATLELFSDNQELVYSKTTEYDSEVRCSYDPNDKLVRSNLLGQSEFAYLGDTILYTVRFQNTGNDTAFNIRIEDVLDKKLDWTTFHPITASHDYRTEFNRNTGLVTFYFDDILLPDSTINEVESHGFVMFGIASKSELEDKTEVDNTASIFFDFNPPIITNTAAVTLIEGVETDIEDSLLDIGYSILVRPNPFSDYTTIEVSGLSSQGGNYCLEVRDILGRKVGELKLEEGKVILQRGELESGLYLIQVVEEGSGEVLGSGKVLVE